MKYFYKTHYFSSLIGLFLICLFLQNCKSSSVAKEKNIAAQYAITNVSILSKNANSFINNQTVLLNDGKIVAIGETKGGENTTIIDGKGKFLIPGLTEMHAHIPVAEEGKDSLVKETLFLYLSQGITNIRGMLGNPYHLELRKEVAEGKILGPRIYTSSPSLNGNSIKTEEEAITKITQYQKDGYDFLKIHPGIKLSVWDAVEKTANSVGIPFAGHVPVEVGIRRALASKYKTIDHIDGYLEGLVPVSEEVDPTTNGFFGFNFTDLADPALMDGLVDLTVENNVGIVATQSLFTRWFSPTAPEILGNESEMKYMSPKTLFTWRQNKTQLIGNEAYDADKWERFILVRKNLLRKMNDAGVNFLLGSDAPQVFNVPGFSIHHELKAMNQAGISNEKLLKAGTVNPAKFFGAAGEYGTIEIGASADLVLLNDNPLLDISNAQKIDGVMLGNTWLSKSIIQERLTAIANRYAE